MLTVIGLAANAVRVRHRDSRGTLPDDPVWLADVAPGIAAPAAGACDLRVDGAAGAAVVTAADGTPLLREAAAPRWRGARLRLQFRTAPGERFAGGGEWFDAFARQHGRVRLRSRESPWFLQGRQTYSTLPFFLSERGYGLLLLNAHGSDWRFDRAGLLTIDADGPPADYVVIHGPTPRRIVATYTALTGRPPLPPRWAFGLWLTGYPQAPQDEVVAQVAAHRQRRVPLDAIILDYHWEDRFHDFRWRTALFPDPDALIAALRAQGVRLGLIFTPFVNAHNAPWQKWLLHRLVRNLPPGHEQDDERALPEYAEARRRGLFAHDDARWWFGRGGMIDFTNPEAARWWTDRLRPLYARGIAFFKNDDGEYLPADARARRGMDGREYHNQYGFHYGRALYEAMTALDDRRGLVFARSVWVGSQRYPALFLGDQTPSFTSLRRTLRAGLNLAVGGFAYWGADVFGLNGRTTPETHARYAQWTLFTPIARYFVRPAAIDDTRWPWSHDAATAASFRRHVELRYRLLPYYCTLAWEAYEHGVPILRPLCLEFPDEPRAWTVDDQAMLGAALLLAPVTRAGATRRRVQLPAGRWHDWWSPASWDGGGAIDYPAPRDRLPLLARGGHVVPLGPVLQHIPDGHRFTTLEVHAFPPWPARGRIVDDDGVSRAYQRGASTALAVAVEPGDGGVRISVTPERVDGPDAPIDWTVVLHRSAPRLRVERASVAVTAVHDAAAGAARVSFRARPVDAVSIDVVWPPV